MNVSAGLLTKWAMFVGSGLNQPVPFVAVSMKFEMSVRKRNATVPVPVEGKSLYIIWSHRLQKPGNSAMVPTPPWSMWRSPLR